jgi:hypothetical protein
VSILETGGYVMTELRRTHSFVGLLRAERIISQLRSCEFVPVAVPRDDSVTAPEPRFIGAPPL